MEKEKQHQIRATALMEESPEEQAKKLEKKQNGKIIGAITLVLYDDFGCDMLAKTRIDDYIFDVDANLLHLFKGFLEDVCGGIMFSQVLSKWLDKNSSES